MLRTSRMSLRVGVVVIGLMLLGYSAEVPQGRAEGSISGVVTDQTKAVLPGVTVTGTNTATGLVRTSVSEPDGRYRLSALPPGTYEIAAELPGFATFKRTIPVTVGAETTLDIVLEPVS